MAGKPQQPWRAPTRSKPWLDGEEGGSWSSQNAPAGLLCNAEPVLPDHLGEDTPLHFSPSSLFLRTVFSFHGKRVSS